MIRALGLLLLCGGCAAAGKALDGFSRTWRDPTTVAPTTTAHSGVPHDAAGRAARGAAMAERDARQREQEARRKREAEARAARDAEQRKLLAANAAENARKAREAYDRNKARQRLLMLTPARAEQLSAHCPTIGYYIMLGQGIAGVAEPGAMYNELGEPKPLLDLGLLSGNLDMRIPMLLHLYQECGRESIYQGRGAWVAPWPITTERQKGG